MPTGCPSCSGRQVCKCSSLAALRPDLMAQWDFLGNAHLDAEQISPGSHKKVSWLCAQHGAWLAMVQHRSNGGGCPQCAVARSKKKRTRRGLLRDEHPELVAQLHPTENDHVNLEKLTSGSEVKAVWVCNNRQNTPYGCTHPHIWTAAVKVRSGSKNRRGHGCPFCAGRVVCPCNSLAVKAPEVAAQWHPSRNGNKQPDQVGVSSSLRVWWQHVNEVTGEVHEWIAQVKNRVGMSSGCPLCDRDRRRRLISRAH